MEGQESVEAEDHAIAEAFATVVNGEDTVGEEVAVQAAAMDPRQAEWDLLVPLLGLDESGIAALVQAGIHSIDDVELFGSGGTAEVSSSNLEALANVGLNLVTRQKLLVVATFLLNDGSLTPESTLAQMARANAARAATTQAAAAAAAAPVVKRGRGRPRKTPEAASTTPPAAKRPVGRPPGSKNKKSPAKRGPGRPRKDGSFPPAKKGPGRPRKNPVAAAASASPPVKRGVGRPRKHPIADEAAAAATKRGPGRPRKNPPADDTSPPVKRGVGRPRKHPVAEEAEEDAANPPVKRGVGRPRKQPVAEEAAAAASPAPSRRGPGRPRKSPLPDYYITETTSPSVKRGRGRPRKHPLPEEEAKIDPDGGEPPFKRPRGRPRKNPLPPAEEEEETKVEDDTAAAGLVMDPDTALAAAVEDEMVKAVAEIVEEEAAATEVYRGPPMDDLKDNLAWPGGWVKVTTSEGGQETHAWITPGGKTLRSLDGVHALLKARAQCGGTEEEAWNMANL